MEIKRVKKHADVGNFFVEAIIYVSGDGGMRKITSKMIDLDEVKRFLQICKDLRGIGMVSTMQAIRQMKDGKTLEGWFEKYLFDGYWPSLARLSNYNIFQIAEDGVYQVEIPE